ncbi:MAG: phosphoglycerate dehydrogenase [Rhodospirillaceae bacterium]|jgi:phosphoglycerate dehydrogenase-like enzyme|nr:phosphoglycerate dehydrogenase [Rhodospirillaceae bacterium]MBT3494005.1 phosphoglycerate dehydrogenase [Rhodospirillaceae bacterium]MBT3778874.1 phosphoglycerate dehydrogenase [Rhodospirillaceae bacterium]MBT3976464.1 phosphoglycerate dehydrogenase [Rhodospirillaceae bacterium]MBT4170008.1 phosphoglycerate dehydrogenase [Rhodospirillaceae bacterium]
MTDKPILFLAGRMAAPRKDWMAAALQTEWNILTWAEDEPFEDFAAQVPRADAIVGGRIHGLWPAVPKLRLYQLPFTGFHWIEPSDVPFGCTVCNTYEHEIAISEYVLGAMLEREIGTVAADRKFRGHGWDGGPSRSKATHGELFGKTIGIVGYGHIGAEVARRANAFGMRCIAVTRTSRPAPEPLEWLGAMQALDRLLNESDYVLLALPLADDTHGLIDAKRFARMKPDGVIINVGRGLVIDEGALYAALDERRIGGAIIDVWYNYPSDEVENPAPSRYPFQELDNIIMTPHSSSHSEAARLRRWTSIAANVDRLARGEALRNVCFEGTGQKP